MKNKKITPELLAPAGNLEKMKTAFAFGADAVYLGIPDFSLRVRINDFTMAKIKQAIEYAHRKNKKVYVTINIFAHNQHLKKLPKYIKKLKELKVDALIISDPGVIATVKENWPKAEIHLSTQANCINWQAAKFWQKAGVSRIILGREVTLKDIKEIHKKCPKLELEYFVHGAMCMSYSGRCFLSKYYLDKSANLGDCVQPCRWNYQLLTINNSQLTKEKNKKLSVNSEKLTVRSQFISAENHEDDIFELVEEEHGSYILNSKDLCLIEYLGNLQKAGVSNFKIEGRAKSVYYQAVVMRAYEQAIAIINSKLKQTEKQIKIKNLKKELESRLMHRGFTDGFLLGEKADQNIANSCIKSDWEFCGQVVAKSKKNLEISKKIDSKNLLPRNFNINKNKNSLTINCKLINNFTNKKCRRQNLICVKVHNSIKIGDQIEIVTPFCDIIKIKLKNIWNAQTGAKMQKANGGGSGHVVFIEVDRDLDERTVLRRKI